MQSRIIFKKIYNEMKEDMFDQSNVRNLKTREKTLFLWFFMVAGDTLLCFQSVKFLAKVILIGNLCGQGKVMQNLELHYLAVMVLGLSGELPESRENPSQNAKRITPLHPKFCTIKPHHTFSLSVAPSVKTKKYKQQETYNGIVLTIVSKSMVELKSHL